MCSSPPKFTYTKQYMVDILYITVLQYMYYIFYCKHMYIYSNYVCINISVGHTHHTHKHAFMRVLIK